jgi:hypothetical protein
MDREAGRESRLRSEDLDAFEREQNRFDRDFFEDPLTGKFRARRAPRHTDEESGRTFTLLGDKEGGFRLSESTVGEVSGSLTQGPEPLVAQDAPQNLFAAPAQNFLGEVGPRAEPEQDDVQKRVMEILQGKLEGGEEDVTMRQRRLDMLRQGGRAGLREFDISQSKENRKRLGGLAKDVTSLTSKKVGLMEKIRRIKSDDILTEDEVAKQVAPLESELRFFESEQRRLVEEGQKEGLFGGVDVAQESGRNVETPDDGLAAELNEEHRGMLSKITVTPSEANFILAAAQELQAGKRTKLKEVKKRFPEISRISEFMPFFGVETQKQFEKERARRLLAIGRELALR